jgi:hypothetical protein
VAAGAFAAVVIACAALAGGVFALQGDAGGHASAATARDPVDELRSLAARDPQAALAELRGFADVHAFEPELVLARYDAVLGVLPAAAAAKDRFVKDRELAAAAAFDELRLDVRDLIDVQGKKDEALRRLDGFSPRWKGTKAWAQRDDLKREVAAGR